MLQDWQWSWQLANVGDYLHTISNSVPASTSPSPSLSVEVASRLLGPEFCNLISSWTKMMVPRKHRVCPWGSQDRGAERLCRVTESGYL